MKRTTNASVVADQVEASRSGIGARMTLIAEVGPAGARVPRALPASFDVVTSGCMLARLQLSRVPRPSRLKAQEIET